LSSNEESCCFLLSLPRTGSTLLRLLLDTHSEVYAPDELRLGNLCQALLRAAEGLHDSSRPAAIAEARAIAAGLMAAHTSRRGKRLWCEKSPGNLEHLDALEAVFPQARYVVLHRHCLDTVGSTIRSSHYGFNLPLVASYLATSTGDFVAPLVRLWVDKVEELLAFEDRHPGSCLRLRYEDLVADPDGQLAPLCTFLGIAFESELSERVFRSPHHQRVDSGDGDAFFSRRISATSVGRGRDIPLERLQRVPASLWEAMNRTLVRLGYAPVEDAAAWHGITEPGVSGEKPSKTCEPPLSEIFELRLPARLDEGRPALAGSSFRFVVSGTGGGTWLVDLTGSPGRVIPNGEGGTCEVRVGAVDLQEVLAGRRNPVTAFKEGTLQLRGRFDLQLLRALIDLLL
jgi:hypothetical protein